MFIDIEMISFAKELINTINHEVLTPENFVKLQQCIYSRLDINPNPVLQLNVRRRLVIRLN